MKPHIISLLFISLLLEVQFSSCQGNQPENVLIPFSTGLNKPVCISNCGDSRLFVTDQTGFILILDSDGNVNPVPFLDIHERVTYGGEQGLLGLAFHPDYLTNGYFYVNYTGDGDSTHVSRFSVSGSNPDLADPASELNILTIYQPYTNHNGGDLQFGPDGYLYIGMGDGGSAGDPQNRAQNPMELLGKMLRIDVDNGNPYAIPVSNPFYGSLNARNEIWAMGLRNPWRFSFDRLTGDLWIGDVGQNQIEEIDYQSSSSTGGENYGWRCYEGNQFYNNDGCGPEADYTFPVYTYPHGEECSVTGGYVYRGNPSSPFYGQYFFADYCSDRIWTLSFDGSEWVRGLFGQFPGNGFSTFGENSTGQLFIAGLTSGTIYLLDDNSTGVNGPGADPGISIIQRPFSGKISLVMKAGHTGPVQVAVYNINGVLQYRNTVEKDNQLIDLDHLANGLYLLKITSDRGNAVHKLIICN